MSNEADKLFIHVAKDINSLDPLDTYRLYYAANVILAEIRDGNPISRKTYELLRDTLDRTEKLLFD